MSTILAVAAVGLVLLLVERVAPGRAFPRVPGFVPRAVLFSVFQAAIAWAAGVSWDPWLRAHRPWSLDGLGVAGGAVVGYLAITLVYYGWHRARHEVPFLWRHLHQLHHSPRRIEVLTSFYKHPLEIVANGLLSSAVLYVVVGVGREAATIAVLLTGLAELFYHWNVRTPRWVGFFVQRPEMHCVHHEKGVHTSNFADLPLWDMIFGTYRNPASFEGECGFDAHEERDLAAMLRGRDLHAEGAR